MIADAGPDTPLHLSFASVRDGGQAVGAGVLVAERLVLTCAHVVNSALGRGRFVQQTPGHDDTVTVRLPHVAAGRDLTARVVREMWVPPRATARGGDPVVPGSLPYHGDLAVLELAADPPAGAAPAPFLLHHYGNDVIALWASGNPLPTVRAVPRVSAPPWIALDVTGGAQVTEGFSGGPLWDRERQAVVGLVAAVHRAPEPAAPGAPPATMYAISVPAIEAELPTLPPSAVPTARRGVQQLLVALERVLQGRQAVLACEERLAARLGRPSAGPAADLERLVGLAVGVRRGIPELLDLVRDHVPYGGDPYGADRYDPHARAGGYAARDDWERLRRAARAVRPGEFLTTRQRRDLSGLLAYCTRTDPRALLEGVLPHAPELPAVTGLADAVDALEGFGSTAGAPVPPLLQGVVRISADERSAGAFYPAEDLDAWVERVAARCGVDDAAVSQFRADLAAAAPTTPPGGATARINGTDEPAAAPRVQVELLPTATGRRFTYQIWAWADRQSHRLALVRDAEAGSEQVVDDIRRVLRTEVREDPETALVEYFLPSAWLGLEVDSWESCDSDEDGPFAPGITRRVVVRTTERSRESYAGWKQRTAALPHAKRLVLDHRHTDRKVARAQLEVHRDAGTVILCCEPHHHGTLLRQCVQAGVHTVLWHRAEHGAQIARDLLAIVEGTDHTQVPEAVRLERAKAMAEPESASHHGRRLSLLYDAPDHRPPQLAPDAWVLTQP
ncbi:trypsin-like peptidase domain-containing protein [Streptomyces piniterrae]|uniref:Trypsin-like peptidase domain-containing protein n=1 Tax=Streptomyces piniterrae TaxID=2571125 RepID=A0A4V5MIV7_9ACTN|nr:trypsin-like peptidase domain-containing protein [Streptomyces piniterrae]TJZ46118.1 trypsin-like peptidase domain-containing protein [Streptomyces piniterrae]